MIHYNQNKIFKFDSEIFEFCPLILLKKFKLINSNLNQNNILKNYGNIVNCYLMQVGTHFF